MIYTVPTVFESRVINAPIDKVWDTLRTLQFPFWKLVDKTELEATHISSVGSERKIHYRDGTIQTYRIVELSDYNFTIIYELVLSNPAVDFLSVVHTIRCKQVTYDNSTFVEWSSLFSSDADQQIVQDSQFKKQDALKDLSDFLKQQ